MNKKILALAFIIGVLVGYCIAVVVYYTAPPEISSSRITTPVEIQQILVDAVNNQYASVHDYMYQETE